MLTTTSQLNYEIFNFLEPALHVYFFEFAALSLFPHNYLAVLYVVILVVNKCRAQRHPLIT